jgi:hypothetical protein
MVATLTLAEKRKPPFSLQHFLALSRGMSSTKIQTLASLYEVLTAGKIKVAVLLCSMHTTWCTNPENCDFLLFCL